MLWPRGLFLKLSLEYCGSKSQLTQHAVRTSGTWLRVESWDLTSQGQWAAEAQSSISSTRLLHGGVVLGVSFPWNFYDACALLLVKNLTQTLFFPFLLSCIFSEAITSEVYFNMLYNDQMCDHFYKVLPPNVLLVSNPRAMDLEDGGRF